MSDAVLPATAFKKPAVALSGVVDYNMYVSFRQQFDNASSQDLVVIELSTLGGDPEVARMMGEDVRFASETEPGRRFVFLGKAVIYSAGTTFMSADSDEAGHAFQFEAGRAFRSEAGHPWRRSHGSIS